MPRRAARDGAVMSTSTLPFDEAPDNPLDLVEEIVVEHGWPLDRPSDLELTTVVEGRWCDYRLWFSWREEPGALQFSCAFDLRVEESHRTPVSLLLVLVNERMWLGHFDLWSRDGVLMFHHALILGGAGVTAEQFETLVEVGLAECDRFYPAFGMVLSGANSPDGALIAAVLETDGEA